MTGSWTIAVVARVLAAYESGEILTMVNGPCTRKKVA
jgi:hypothetical protein